MTIVFNQMGSGRLNYKRVAYKPNILNIYQMKLMKYYKKIMYLLKKKKKLRDLGHQTNLLVKQRREKLARMSQKVKKKVKEVEQANEASNETK